jgi:uncharacterized caspase-like protein
MKQLLIILGLLLLQSQASQATVYAVIIGVSKFDDPTANVQFTDDDARHFYDYLLHTSKGIDPANLTLLIDRQATKANIIAALNTQFRKATTADRVIFFFAGHGSQGLFCPYDAFVSGNNLYHFEVKKAFKNSAAKVKLCFANACHSGSIKEKLVFQSNALSKTQQSSLSKNNGNLIVFMSSRPTETSYDGVFTTVLLRGLNGQADLNSDKQINITELYTYVRQSVRLQTKNLQTPIVFGNFDRNLVMVSL